MEPGTQKHFRNALDPFDGPHYALIDTLFSLAKAYLFEKVVDFKDINQVLKLNGNKYTKIQGRTSLIVFEEKHQRVDKFLKSFTK